MKKTLLAIFCTMAMTFMAKADEVVVVFAGFNYQGSVTNKVEFPEGNTETSINDKNFEVPDVCTFTFHKNVETTGFSYINPEGQKPHLQWAKQTSLNFTPAKDVTITKITFQCTTTGYTQNLEVDHPENCGECSIDETVATWSGSSSTEFGLTFKPKKSNPMRISYMEIEYTKSSSAIDTVVTDTDTPVEYFNLLGVKVDAPKGGIYIRHQGSETTKVIM